VEIKNLLLLNPSTTPGSEQKVAGIGHLRFFCCWGHWVIMLLLIYCYFPACDKVPSPKAVFD
jgi:hypothetical protein